HVRALCLSARIGERYNFVVHTRIDPRADGMYRFCRDNGIGLFHNYTQVLGDEFYERYQPLEDFAPAEPPQFPDEGAEIAHRIFEECRNQVVLLRSCRRLMQQMKVSLLVMFEDNAEDDTGVWVAAAREIAIPTVIVPFTIADQIEPAESHFH